jgi:hypothetical protein
LQDREELVGDGDEAFEGESPIIPLSRQQSSMHLESSMGEE